MYSFSKRFQYRTLVPWGISISRLFLAERNLRFKKPLNPPPFFIIGSGRNGSTLLSAMLNKNPELFLPPEQFVLPYAMMQWDLYRHISTDTLFQRFLKMFSLPEKTSNWNIDFAELKKSFDAENTTHWGFNNFTDHVFRFYGNQTKTHKYIWGDQSPMTTHFVPFITKLFPAAKFIFLVRDPRDVVLSYSKIESHPAKNYKIAAWRWNDGVKIYNWLMRKHDKPLLLVKYEDLVEKPEETLKNICAFLQISFNPEMLDHRDQINQLGVSGVTIHTNLKNKINTGSIGKWKKEFTPEKAKEVTSLVSKNMKQFGYE